MPKKRTHSEYVTILRTRAPKTRAIDLYIDARTPIRHRCDCGRIWKVRPDDVLHGHRCPDCKAVSLRTRHEEYVRAVKRRLPGYAVLSRYTWSLDDVKVRCPKGHVFRTYPRSLLTNRVPCHECKRPRCKKKTHEIYLRELAERGVKARPLDRYAGANVKIRHVCVNGHEFAAKPNTVLKQRQDRCGRCVARRGPDGSTTSATADAFLAAVEKATRLKFVREFPLPGTRWRVDGFNRHYGVCVEFYGDWYHGNPKLYAPDDVVVNYKPASYHYAKTKERERTIRRRGLAVVAVWESDYRRDRIAAVARAALAVDRRRDRRRVNPNR